MNTPWTEYMEPFKIKGNLYFVGCSAASSHLIDTGEGLILIDTGYPQNLYLLINSIYKLGFSPYDVKYIVHSHGHYDHLGATKAFCELTKSTKTFIGEQDKDYANGKVNLTWARELGYTYYEAFEPDFLMKDGDVVELGNTKIEIASTPGHTPGTVSMFFDVYDGDKLYKAAMHGGVGTNSMEKKWLLENGLSLDCRRDFIDEIDKIIDREVDIFIGNHCWNNDTGGKYKRLLNGDENAFVNKNEWRRFLNSCKENIKKMIEDE